MAQRFGNMAGVFKVMAFAVRALDKGDADVAFMSKLAKIATAEMISSKVLFVLLLITASNFFWGGGVLGFAALLNSAP